MSLECPMPRDLTMSSPNAPPALVFFQFSLTIHVSMRDETPFRRSWHFGRLKTQTRKEAGDALGFQEINHAGQHGCIQLVALSDETGQRIDDHRMGLNRRWFVDLEQMHL